MTVASADINMQMKHNVICHVTKVKKIISATFSVHSCFNSFWRINITGCVIQSRSRLGRVEVCVWSPTKKIQKKKKNNNNKSRAKQEPRSAHGRAVNKSRVKQEPRSAHGRAVNNKSRVKQEPRSAHGRAVKK